MSRREEVLERVAFSVGGRDFRWREVVAAARSWGDWDRVERQATYALWLSGNTSEPVSAHDLETAQNEFRYERNLLAADDLEAWLDGWGLTVTDWLDLVRARVHGPHGAKVDPGTGPADDAALATAAWAEAVCSGGLERLARKLAERCAVWKGTEAGNQGELTADELASMEEAHRRFRDEAVSDAALERQVREEALEWTRIDGRYLAHADEDVVREAALCVREEGRDLEEMARTAGARYEGEASFYLADTESDLKTRLVAASPGELHGPLPSGDEHWLLEVHARVPPSLEDPEVRARATKSLTDAAIEGEVLRRVRWRRSSVE